MVVIKSMAVAFVVGIVAACGRKENPPVPPVPPGPIDVAAAKKACKDYLKDGQKEDANLSKSAHLKDSEGWTIKAWPTNGAQDVPLDKWRARYIGAYKKNDNHFTYLPDFQVKNKRGCIYFEKPEDLTSGEPSSAVIYAETGGDYLNIKARTLICVGTPEDTAHVAEGIEHCDGTRVSFYAESLNKVVTISVPGIQGIKLTSAHFAESFRKQADSLKVDKETQEETLRWVGVFGTWFPCASNGCCRVW